MLPPFRQLLGNEPDTVDPLFDYGYRAAWKATAAGEIYLVKGDDRGNFAEREVASNRHVAAHGILVPGLVRTTGEPVQFMAFRWVPGATLDGVASADAWRAAGRTLRHLHRVPIPPSAPNRVDYLAWFEAELGWMVENAGLSVGEAQTALSVGHALRGELEAAPSAWIHGDCQAAHFVINENDAVAAVIDWGDAQPGPAEMDFAVMTLFHEHTLQWLLEGYEADAPFRERLALTIPLYQAVRAAGSLRWLETHGYPGHTWPLEKVRELRTPQ